MAAHSALAGSAFAVAMLVAPASLFILYLEGWRDRFHVAASAAASAAHVPVAEALLALASATLQDSRFWAVVATAWAATVIAAAAAALACGSLGLRPSAVAPNPARILGQSGFRRLASSESLIQAAGAGLAVLLIAVLSIPMLMQYGAVIAQMRDTAAQAETATQACTALWWRAVAALAIAGALDVAVQRRRHAVRLKMSPRELREERAQTEGRPEAKQRRRAVGARRVRNLRIVAIRRATAVITNPTHVAIALRYAPPEIDVPTVVARGADLMAPVVRAAARAFGVPVVESPELARMLYLRVDVDEPIPEECYAAVAAIFTWIMRTRGPLRRGDEENP